ncbi:MAG: CHRD domain-containing protein, partial [Anaerolineae bacterium]
MRQLSGNSRSPVLELRSKTPLVVVFVVLTLLAIPWVNLPYSEMDWVALSQPYDTIFTHFQATLLGSNEAPRVDTMAYGIARLSLSEDQTQLAYRISVANIDNIFEANIHLGTVGTNGSKVLELYNGTGPFDPDNPIAGTLNVTSSQATNLLVGRLYVNIRTTDFSNGEVRGQIVRNTVVRRYEARMSGDREVPPVDTAASGRAMLFLSDDETRLTYRVSVDDIENITAANIHLAPAGQNGPIIHELYDGTGTFDPTNPITGTLTLLAGKVTTLRDGEYYVNVQTTAHPEGEIRGQVAPQQQYSALKASLSGEQETPPVAIGSSGQGTFVLNADQTQLSYRISVQNIEDITAAHIHRGQPGEDGPVVFDLYDGTGSFDPDNPISGALELPATAVQDLLAGNYYANVHTTENPEGEIRGQIIAFTPAGSYEASLSGANEVPAVSTTAAGLGSFTLDSNLTHLDYLVTVANIENITAAHIHRAPAGQTGPVAHTLFDGSGT